MIISNLGAIGMIEANNVLVKNGNQDTTG